MFCRYALLVYIYEFHFVHSLFLHSIFLKHNFKILFIKSLLAALGLCCCTWAFPSCKEQGLLSSWAEVASVCGGFSCEARAVGLGLSHCAPGLCCPMACESVPDQGANWCPCIAKQTLNHWTTRDTRYRYFGCLLCSFVSWTWLYVITYQRAWH